MEENSKFLAMARRACVLKRDEVMASRAFRSNTYSAYYNARENHISLYLVASALGVSYQHLLRVAQDARSEFLPESGPIEEFIEKAVNARNARDTLYQEWIKAVQDAIKVGREEGLTMKYIAEKIAISPMHAYRILRKEVGNAER